MPADSPAVLEARILDDLVLLVATRIAFQIKLPRRMQRGPASLDVLGVPDEAGLRLMAMLKSGGLVAEAGDGTWCLTPEFADLLAQRGVSLEARVQFTAMAATDLLSHGQAWLQDMSGFMSRAATFGFFDYARAGGTNAAALEDTAPWVNYVTAITEIEAPQLAGSIPLEGCGSVLEIGGNTGAMALELLKQFPDLQAVIMDLPAVCRLGERYVEGRPEASRLSFGPGDARRDPWPDVGGRAAEAVLFKSVLHDWSADATKDMLARAAAYLPAGGRLIVCERGRSEDEGMIAGTAIAADLVFAPFYRRPEWYADAMYELGLTVRDQRTTSAGMTFHVVWAVRP